MYIRVVRVAHDTWNVANHSLMSAQGCFDAYGSRSFCESMTMFTCLCCDAAQIMLLRVDGASANRSSSSTLLIKQLRMLSAQLLVRREKRKKSSERLVRPNATQALHLLLLT